MTRPVVAVVCCVLFPAAALAQVEVEVRTTKAAYLEGEPVFVRVDVKNVGPYPLGHSVGPKPVLKVAGQATRPPLPECDGLISEMTRGVIDHPPLFEPGKTVSFTYALKGYRLRPGNYTLHISGHADVTWFDYINGGGVQTGPTPRFAPPPSQRGEPVPGAGLDRDLPIVVEPTSAAELRAVYVTLAERWTYDRVAVEGIFEMAVPSVADIIGRLAANDDPRFLYPAAYEALAEINSVETRARLRSLFDASDSLRRRALIASALAHTRHPDNRAFFSSLLAGHTSTADERIKRTAKAALACIP